MLELLISSGNICEEKSSYFRLMIFYQNQQNIYMKGNQFQANAVDGAIYQMSCPWVHSWWYINTQMLQTLHALWQECSNCRWIENRILENWNVIVPGWIATPKKCPWVINIFKISNYFIFKNIFDFPILYLCSLYYKVTYKIDLLHLCFCSFSL